MAAPANKDSDGDYDMPERLVLDCGGVLSVRLDGKPSGSDQQGAGAGDPAVVLAAHGSTKGIHL